MSQPAIVTANEMSALSRFDPAFGIHWAVVCGGRHVQLVRARYEPGVPYGMHAHEHDQVSVLVEGRLRLTVGDLTRDIAAGDIWFAPAGVPHGGEVIGTSAAVFLDIYGPSDQGLLELFEARNASGARSRT